MPVPRRWGGTHLPPLSFSNNKLRRVGPALSLKWYMSRPPSVQKRAAQSEEDGWWLYTEALAKGYVRMMNIPKTFLTDSEESSGETPPWHGYRSRREDSAVTLKD